VIESVLFKVGKNFRAEEIAKLLLTADIFGLIRSIVAVFDAVTEQLHLDALQTPRT